MPLSTPGADELERERRRRHRLDPSAPIMTAADAAAYVEDRRIVVQTGRSEIAILAWAIAGRQFAGSWMAQPEAHRIYDLIESLRPPRCWTVRLIEGKYAVVGSDVAPVVARYASDGERVAAAEARLSPAATRLLDVVRRHGAVRMDEWPGTTAERAAVRHEIDRALLAVTSEVHAEGRGTHVAVVRPWEAGPFADVEPCGTTFADTIDALVSVGLHSAVVAPGTAVRRWIPEAGAALERLLADGRAVTVDGRYVALHRSVVIAPAD